MIEMLMQVPPSGPTKTISLLRLDGTDQTSGNSGIVDRANEGRIWTRYANTSFINGSAKFGASALRINAGMGISGRLQIATSITSQSSAKMM